MADELVADIERIYRSEYRRFLRVALGVLRDEDRAVDAVQEAFAAAVQRRLSFRGDGPLEAWIWRMVVNAALKEQAKRRPLQLVENEAAAPPPAEPFGVEQAIAQLPERQRLALFLRYYADLDYGSIATALNVTAGTVGATLNAAHAALRRMLLEVQP
jgi:RNA polymerase sigma-70 factor (ECF subfamily)